MDKKIVVIRSYFALNSGAKGHKKGNKGNSGEPFVYRSLAVVLRARVGEDLK